VTMRDQPQRPGRRRQTLAHRHGSLWGPRHPPARRHQPQTGDDLKVVVLRGALIDAGEQCQRDKPIVQFVLHASSAVLAVSVGLISDSNQIMLTMIIFGSLATGLISEKTLVKILSWNRKK